jgi:hypothetical protein
MANKGITLGDKGEELRSRLQAVDGGFLTVSLNELRDAVGAKRLGRYVLEEIVEWLEAERLGFFPSSVLTHNDEPSQSQEVRLYLNDGASPLSLLVAAVQEPTLRGDRTLRSAIRSEVLNDVHADAARAQEFRSAMEFALTVFEAG